MKSYFKLFLSLFLPSLKSELYRSLLSVLAISIGVSTMLAIRVANRGAIASFDEAVRSVTNSNSLYITTETGEIQSSLYPELKKILKEFGEIAPVTEAYGKIRLEKKSVLLRLIGTDIIGAPRNDSKLYAVSSTGASDSNTNIISALQDTEEGLPIFVHYSLREELDIGKTYETLVADSVQKLNVVGFFKPQKDGVEKSFAIIDISHIQELLGDYDGVTRYELSLKENLKAEEVLQAVEEKLPDTLLVNTPSLSLGGADKMAKAFHFNLSSLGSISILVGILLIFNVSQVSIQKRQYMLGLLRSLGGGRYLVFSFLVLEMLLLTLISIPIGIYFGTQLARFVVIATAETTSLFYLSQAATLGVSSAELLLSDYLVVILGSLGATLLAVLGPAYRAASTPPNHLLLQQADQSETKLLSRSALLFISLATLAFGLCFLPPLEGRPIWGFLASIILMLSGVCLFPIVLKALLFLLSKVGDRSSGRTKAIILMVRSSLEHSFPQVISGGGALVVSLSMSVALMVMILSFRETVNVWVGQTLTRELIIRPTVNDSPEFGATLPKELYQSAIQGVRELERIHSSSIMIEDKLIELIAKDLPNSEKNLPFLFKKQRSLRNFIDGAGIIISETYQIRYGANIGEPLEILGEALPIEGIFYDYASTKGKIVLAWPLLEKLAPRLAKSVHSAALTSTGEMPISAVKENILELLTHPETVFIVSRDWIQGEVMRIFDSTFVITYALLLISLIVAAIGIVGALTLLILSRQGSLAVLRYIGARKSDILLTISIESLLIGLASVVAATLVGLLLGVILTEVINPQSFAWTIQLRFPGEELLLMSFLVLVIALLSSLIPLRLASKSRPQEVLRNA